MNSRIELKLFQELKDKAYSVKDNSIEGLTNQNIIYDIDPIINYNLLNSLLQKEENEFIKKYFSLIQTLTFKQKISLNEELLKHPILINSIEKNININNKSYIESYFLILRKIYNFVEDKLNYRKFEKILKTEYYVDNSHLKIPLIYGTRELNFSYLINNIYHYFILYNKPQENDDNNKISINNNNKSLFLKEYPKSILKKREGENTNNNNKNNMEIEKEEVKDNKQETKNMKTEDEINKIFREKCLFIRPILEILFENDDFFDVFQVNKYKNEEEIQNFQEGYKMRPNLDALYFHLLFIDFIICIYTINKKDDFLTQNIIKKFFERKKDKLITLQFFLEYVDFESKNGEKCNFTKTSDIKNELYKCFDKENKNNFFWFNPYEHILSDIKYDNFESFKNKFNDEKYFSLLKYYNINHLFKNEKLESMFKDNIKDMLQSKIIDELFSEFINFSKFNNPFSGERKDDFIHQISEVILFFPFPVEKIGGFTYKNSGLIFINNTNDDKKFVDSTMISYNICKLAIDKITLMHEIIAHYTSTICHANDEKNQLITPPSSFKNYFPLDEFIESYDSYDAGDRAEALIFGNKIKTLFINGALFILDTKNWNSYNNIDDFKNKFIEVNNFNDKNNSLNISCLKKENNLLSELLISYQNTNIIILNKRNSYFVFRTMDDDNLNKNEDEFNICWERINKIQLPYQEISFD